METVPMYFGCAVTSVWGVKEAFQLIDSDLNYIHVCRELITTIELAGGEVTMRHLGSPDRGGIIRDITAADLFISNNQKLHQARFGVFEVSIPSHGVGDEIRALADAGKPVLLLLKAGARFSKHTRGLAEVMSNVTLIEYESVNQARQFLVTWLQKVGSIVNLAAVSPGQLIRIIAHHDFNPGQIIAELAVALSERVGGVDINHNFFMVDDEHLDIGDVNRSIAAFAQSYWEIQPALLQSVQGGQWLIGHDGMVNFLLNIAKVCGWDVDSGRYMTASSRLAEYLAGGFVGQILILLHEGCGLDEFTKTASYFSDYSLSVYYLHGVPTNVDLAVSMVLVELEKIGILPSAEVSATMEQL